MASILTKQFAAGCITTFVAMQGSDYVSDKAARVSHQMEMTSLILTGTPEYKVNNKIIFGLAFAGATVDKMLETGNPERDLRWSIVLLRTTDILSRRIKPEMRKEKSRPAYDI